MASATKVSGGPTPLPGVSYLPDKIEVEMDDEIVGRVELEFLDFVKALTDIMKLMHTVKTRHLRSLNPIPPSVLREMIVADNTGPRYKAWDRSCSGAIPGITSSVENLFRSGIGSVTVPSYKQRPVYRKEQKKRKVGLDNDLIEITGKKTKPLWHVVALENPSNIIGHIHTSRGRRNTVEEFSLSALLDKKNRPVSRSRSDQLLVNIKALTGSKVKPSSTDFQSQMDMMLARDAGFMSVAAHKAFLDTLKPHWYKDLLMDAYRAGVLYSIEIVTAFEALGRYYDTNSTSISLAKPKLSYLVMSFPVWDICQASVQRAVEYFLHIVLEIPAENNTLTEWLRTRKLPYLVHQPLTAEMSFLSTNPFQSQKKDSIA